MALKLRSIKIEDEKWERWQAQAAIKSISLTALIVERMEQTHVDQSAVLLLQAQIKELNDTGDAMRKRIVALDGDVSDLSGQLAEARRKEKTIRPEPRLEKGTARSVSEAPLFDPTEKHLTYWQRQQLKPKKAKA